MVHNITSISSEEVIEGRGYADQSLKWKKKNHYYFGNLNLFGKLFGNL